MSAQTDFSQFLRKKPTQETQSDSLSEFAQFKRKEKQPERGAYETLVERPGQIIGQSAVAGLRALPRTAYDLLKTGVSALGGDISKLEESEKNAPDLLKKAASILTPSYEEVRKGQKDKKTYFDKKKSLAQPEGAIERGLEKFGRFVGEAPAFGGIGGARGLASLGGLAAGVQFGEESELGPIGQLVTGAVGALTPGGVKGAVKAIASPKKTLAKGAAMAAKFSAKEALDLQKQIIKDARESGVQLDLGSLTNNKIIQGIQTKLGASSLTGSSLENLKKQLSEQVVGEYKRLSEGLGKAQFETVHEAGSVLKDAITAERDFSKREYANIYNSAKKRLTDASVVYPDRVISTIERLESEMKPGSLKGTEQKAVLQFIEDLKKDVMTPEGHIKGAKVKDLINDKVAIHDIVDYEIEGGTKQLLKTLAKEIDDTIQQYGRADAQFAKDYKLADKKFQEHVKTFRNKNIASSLKTQDPRQLLAKMNTTQGIREIKNSLSRSSEGKELFKDISRFKVDQLLEKSLEQGASNQIQFGKFGNVLTKGKNRELLRELYGPEAFSRFERLAKTSSHIAEAANKFLNTSKTATNLVDLGFAGKLMYDVGHLFSGNPWPILKTGSAFAGTRQLSKLISDPEFLKMVEEAIIASNTNNAHIMKRASDRLLESAQTAIRATGEVSEDATP